MNLLAAIPVWLYFVVLALTFVGAHVLAYRPRKAPSRSAGAAAARVGASVLLLIALVVVRPDEPATVLLALVASVAGGVLSGRAAPAPNERARSTDGAGSGPARGPRRDQADDARSEDRRSGR